jgi:hypothetical protein
MDCRDPVQPFEQTGKEDPGEQSASLPAGFAIMQEHGHLASGLEIGALSGVDHPKEMMQAAGRAQLPEGFGVDV